MRDTTQINVLCFENDIRQVLNNLIANAIDAMRTGGRLIIRAHEVRGEVPGADSKSSRAVNGVRLTIAHIGHGMSPAVLTRVFKLFYTTKD